jgi:hypothetical protein
VSATPQWGDFPKGKEKWESWQSGTFRREKCRVAAVRLSYRDIGGRKPLGSLLDVEGDAVAVIERFEAAGVDRRVVHEDVIAVFLLDKSKTFSVVEPLYCSIGHEHYLLSISFQRCKLEGATLTNGLTFRKRLPWIVVKA